MYRYGIATLFETCPDGYEFTPDNTPLHLTHVDVLDINLEPRLFVDELSAFLANKASFTVIPSKDTNLGPNKDLPVSLIESSPELVSFHSSLISFLERNGAHFDNPQFLRKGYVPHISIYSPRRVELGAPLTIGSLSIGHKRTDIENPPNRIISTIPLRVSGH